MQDCRAQEDEALSLVNLREGPSSPTHWLGAVGQGAQPLTGTVSFSEEWGKNFIGHPFIDSFIQQVIYQEVMCQGPV